MSGKIPERFTKANLPTKNCLTCSRPFTWRKKWARVWDEIRYCSAKCRRDKGADASTKPAPILVIRAPAKKTSRV